MKKLLLLLVLCRILSAQAVPIPFRGPIKFAQTTVAGLGVATPSNKYLVYQVTDGATTSDCTTGLGTTPVICQSNGTTWVPIGSASIAPATIDGSGNISTPGTISVGNTGIADGELDLSGKTSGLWSIKVNDVAGTPSKWVVPTGDPTNGQVLSFGTPSGGKVQLAYSSATGSGIMRLTYQIGVCSASSAYATELHGASITGTWGVQCTATSTIGGAGVASIPLLHSDASADTMTVVFTYPTNVTGILAHIVGFPGSTTANSLTYTAKTGCVAAGALYTSGSQNTGLTVSVSSTTTNTITNFDVTVPAPCNSGDIAYVQLVRGGTYANSYYWENLDIDITRTLP